MWKFVRTGFKHRILDVYSLALADRITVQFQSYKKQYPRILRHKIVAIHNPVFPSFPQNNTLIPSKEKIVLYVARFCYQKNHELLIKAFALLSDSLEEWKLVLAGDGEYLNSIRAQVGCLGLRDRVVFCGAVHDVDSLYRRATVVAFPSYFEGFPNALAEALARGIPCIGLRNTLGVNSLIEDRVNGLLVESTPESFACGLSFLMNNPSVCEKFSAESVKINSMYPPHSAYRLWESLIREIVSC